MKRSSVFGAALCAGLFAMSSANAGTTQTLPGAGGTTSFTVDGWGVTISDCQLASMGIMQASCQGGQVTGSVANGSLTLLFQSFGGGDLLHSAVCDISCIAGGSGLSDLTLTESITAPGGQQITSILLAIAGSASSTASLQNISAGQTVQLPVGNGNIAIDLSAGNPGGLSNAVDSSQSLAVASAAATVLVDMKANGAGGPGTPGDNLTLKSVTQVFNGTGPRTSVPEPAALSVLGMGLAGLLAARRRRANG